MTSSEPLALDVPDPGVGACYRHAGRAFLDEVPLLLVLGLVTAAVGAAGWAWMGTRGVLGLAGLVFTVLVAIPVKWGFYHVCLRVVRGEEAEGRDLLRPFDRHRDAAAAAAVVWLATTVGFCLLVVPGVVLWCRFAFVPYLLTDEGMSAEEALRTSWRLTRGRSWTLFGIGAFGLVLCAVGLAAAGVGVLPALVWWDLAMAAYYHAEVEPSREGLFPRTPDL